MLVSHLSKNVLETTLLASCFAMGGDASDCGSVTIDAGCVVSWLTVSLVDVCVCVRWTDPT